MDDLTRKVQDLKNCLQFSQESPHETRKESGLKVREMITVKLNINHRKIEVERAHRIGKPTTSTAFNVTIRSDRRGTCKGTHVVYACVGYCESSAFPSRYSVLVASNFTHNITSASRCCTISKDAKIKVRLDCPRARHHNDIEILTARACHCDMCRKSHY
ncbi:glycoprotein hormone alpha-2 [Oncorhynchus keta]|uniref:glycoprotein hormone alpha-2 n=1 Tax=Oncorhynchus keta TaxID=8018 RepID=UPI00227A5ABD|nr:glycoprotein hormone alpha-2 [Oncorhynchus keta]